MRKVAGIGLLSIIAAILSTSVALAGVNDFRISHYDIVYTLGRDMSNRSTLETTETITAEFPDFDQNHGIERAIPLRYIDHPTDLRVVSVTNPAGSPLPFEAIHEGNTATVRIGNKNAYAHGTQTYVLRYTQRDVTRFFADTGSDEFYWNTNGLDWTVPIDSLSVELRLDPALQKHLNGNTSCYKGAAGSSDLCSVQPAAGGFTVSSTKLVPGENVTLAVGFTPGTFSVYQPSLLERAVQYWLAIQAVLVAVSIALLIWLARRYSSWSDRKSEHAPIIPEYLPRRDSSIPVAAALTGSRGRDFSALLIDLAVRHYIKIIQVKQTGLFSQDEYEIEIVRSLDDTRSEEKEIMKDIFNTDVAAGDKIELKNLKNDPSAYTRLLDNPKKLTQLIRTRYGLREKDPAKSAWFRRQALIFVIIGLVTLSPIVLCVAAVSFILSYTLHPLTDAGLDQVRYLKGMKMYIGVAEEDRLKMLQSPEGADKVQITGVDDKQLVKLYERMLPYAVLFGQEKSWNKQLGHYYETTHTQPSWYSPATNTAFNAAVFSSAMSSFTSSSSNTVMSSSSSGGSSGGGFSGGGGGGGGGGGW